MFTVPSPISAWYAQFKLYVFLGIAAVIAAGSAYVTYKLMQGNNLKLEYQRDSAIQTAKNFKEELGHLGSSYDAMAQQSKERNARISKLERENFGLRAARANQSKTDPMAKSWYELPIPTSVRELRRHGAGCLLDLSVPCSDSQPRSDSDTPNDGRNERSSRGGNGSLALRNQILQFRQGSRFALDRNGAIKEVAVIEVIPKLQPVEVLRLKEK